MGLNVYNQPAFWVYASIGGALVYPLILHWRRPNHAIDAKNLSKNRTVIVTGATGNLGHALVARLANCQDCRVIMACRDMDKCKVKRREVVLETGNNNIACRKLDLEDVSSINKFADDMIKNEPHIDVLVNYAAVKDVKEKEITKYGIEKNYFVNFIAPFLLTLRLLDKLRESAKLTQDSRIINMLTQQKCVYPIDLSDINFEKRKYTAKAAYGQSKLALAYITQLLDEMANDRKEYLYTYGMDPMTKSSRILKFWPRKTSQWEDALTPITEYNKIHPENVVFPSFKCAMIENHGSKHRSGRYFGLYATHWAWGPLEGTDAERKRVWNHALDEIARITKQELENQQKASDLETTNQS